MGGATNRVLTLLSFSSSSTTTTHFATFPLLLRLPFLSKLSFLPPPLFLSHRRFFSSSSFPCFSLHASHHFHSQTPLKLENFSKPSSSSSPSFRSSSPHHPWPEWYRLVESLFSAGYFNRNLGFDTDNEFVESAALPQDFANAVSACLAFAREKPGLLRLLSRRDMEVAIEHGTPFLFRNSDDSVTRLRSFLSSGNMNVLDTDKAHTVDLMRFILSYASNPLLSSESNNFYNKELVESSIRNLLSELAKLCYSVPDLKSFGSVQRPITEGNGQMERSIGHNIEMKRGDWICPRCSFMNFARNMKCLECEEARPKRQLTGGEWECPQCDFFNYGRNVTCLRCDCKRPGDVSIATTTSNKVETDSRLAANEEEVQKWFSKVSQLDNNSDLNAAADNENFPEILRKGVNRIEANTRRTPLERQLENAQYQRKLGNNASAAGPKVDLSDPSCIPSSVFPQHVQSIEGNSNYAPFVPLPADMFAKKPENSKTGESENKLSENGYYLPSNTTKCTGDASGSNETGNARISGKPLNQSESSNKQKEEAEKSERWFKRVAELHNVTDFANAIPDEDFPNIMPMRKGENRFVVSKKKDRSLTSPTYKRRMAVEQASNNNYVPFVPFPPDYFSKKNKPQPDEADLANKTAGDMNSNDKMAVKLPEKFGNANAEIPYKDPAPQMENQQVIPGRRRNWEASLETQNGSKAGAVSGLSTSGNLSQNFGEPQNNDMSRSSTGHFSQETPNKRINLTENSPQQSKSQNVEKSWTGRSLEGSAVKPPPDPKDMSEEAKAERWFRRVAQIKDISELSQIPDEDFPSIMPMRKGVNRFVVSKRKTPLERRLTSPQYRRNLPIVSSDPVKEENEDN